MVLLLSTILFLPYHQVFNLCELKVGIKICYVNCYKSVRLKFLQCFNVILRISYDVWVPVMEYNITFPSNICYPCKNLNKLEPGIPCIKLSFFCVLSYMFYLLKASEIFLGNTWGHVLKISYFS